MSGTPTTKLTVAVTGGSGQLGTYVLRRLTEDPLVQLFGKSVELAAPRPPTSVATIAVDRR